MHEWLTQLQNRIEYSKYQMKVLELSDKPIYDAYIKETGFPINIWSSNFAYLWAQTLSNKFYLFYGKINKMLVTFVLTHKGRLYMPCLPIGKGKLNDLVDTLIIGANFCRDWNTRSGYTHKSTLIPINTLQLKYLRQSKLFKEHFNEERLSGTERHFSISKLMDLSGKEFSSIRYKLNKFYRMYPNAIIRKYQPNDYINVITLRKIWEEKSGKNYSKILDDYYFNYTLKNYRKLNLEIIVVELDKKIIGMTSGGILPTGDSWGYITKFDPNYQGLSEVLVIEMVRLIHQKNPKVKLLNVGTDLGKKGLAMAKEKFRPIEKYFRYALFYNK